MIALTSRADCAEGATQEPLGAVRLGKYADLTSQPCGSTVCETDQNRAIAEAFLPPAGTVRAWQQRSTGRAILKRAGVEKRIRWCGSRISRGADGVGLHARPDRPYGRVSGVCICGQSLACPVCAPRIAGFRSAEVSECFKRAALAGYTATLCTFTIPHSLGSALGVEIDTFAEAWKRYQAGRKAMTRAAESLGNQVGRECTWGAANGWHYHQHQMRYDKPGTFCQDSARADWLGALASVGRKWRGAEEHAFDAGAVGSEAGAAYVAKLASSVEAQARAVGLEIAAGANKGRNLASLLQDAGNGDERAAAVWLHGVKAITERKVSSVRWSRGFRGAVGMGVEKTDGEVAAEEVLKTDVFLGALNPWQWRVICGARAEFALVCAAQNGEAAVNSFLAGFEVGKLNDEDPRGHWRAENQTHLLGALAPMPSADVSPVALAQLNREMYSES